MREALRQGGTSFDSLYVNVNGQSGYFDRSLAVYGREDGTAAAAGGDPAGEVHEPIVVLLPGLPTAAPAGQNKTMTEPRATDLWVERTGVRRYTGRSSRGAEVLIGSVTDEGVFTPGELMKIALAGCAGLSSDQPPRRRLGDDYPSVIRSPATPTAIRSVTRRWPRPSRSTSPGSARRSGSVCCS